MAIFDRAVLFTKEDCAPCLNTKSFIDREVPEDLIGYLSILQKENHTALVNAYNLRLFPTLLILDYRGIEIDRIVGGKAVRENLIQFLTTIHQHASSL